MKRKILAFIFLFSTSISADLVELKNGQLYEDVKAELLESEVRFSYQDKLLRFLKKEVKRIKLKPVLLKTPTNDLERLEYERERIRVAEALQATTDWEMSANSKPNVAILQLSPGSGVSVAEVESVTNLIRTSLVKTKLFVVLDTSTLNKDCSKDIKDCTNNLSSKVKVNKVVTGTITKIGKKYYINGNVIETKNNTINFAEKATADSPDQLEQAAEYFAKKVAGGIMEYWGEAVMAKELETYVNLKYVIRSSFFPGFGQWQYGEDKEDPKSKNKAYLFSTITILLSVNLFLQLQNRDKLRDNYSESHRNFFLAPLASGAELALYSIDSQNFSKYEKAHNLTLQSAYILIGFYLYNLVDAFFLGKPFYEPTKENSKTSLFFIPNITTLNGTKENHFQTGINFKF